MADEIEAVRLYVDVQTEATEEAMAALEPVLADDVTSRSAMGLVEGKAALVQALVKPAMPGLLAKASWSEPVREDATVRVRATLPEGSMIGGLDFTFHFTGGGQIAAISQQILPAPAPAETPVQLGAEIAEAVGGALDNATPVLVAYVDAGGQPQLSYRGTTQVLGADQLAMWVRDRGGGLLRALPANPRLTLMYRDPAKRVTYQFYGRGRVVDDEAVRTTVFDRSPERERNFDPERRGVAVVVDVDRVAGTGPSGRINMVRRG